ncbi:GOLPH3/VPS74 family protein [Peribacillus frigoritolerans]
MLKELTIPQEFVLLALDRETNKLKPIFRMHIGLLTVMACIVDLSLKGKVNFNDDDTVMIVDSTPTGEKSLDRLLEIMSAEKPKKIKKWVSYFYSYYFKQREIYKLVIESLVEKEILQIENTEILLIVPKKKYVDVMNTRNYIVEKIRAELLEEGRVEMNTIALVLFLYTKNMLNDYFSDFERKALKQKIKELRKEKIFETIKSIENEILKLDSSM